jgi:hypothetical protein
LNDVNIATSFHRLGKFIHSSKLQVVGGGISLIVQKMVEKAMHLHFDSRGTSNVIYGIGNGRLDQLVTNNLCDLLLIKLINDSNFADFNRQELSNSVWSFATMKIYNEKL